MLKPTFLLEGQYDDSDIVTLKKLAVEVRDLYNAQKLELSIIASPAARDSLPIDKQLTSSRISGNWVFFPWNKTLLHIVNSAELFLLRTNRNRDIINTEEQQKLRNFTVAIAGMSAGSNIATTLAHNGFPSCLKLADFDSLETTNLNRMRAGLADVGVSKLDIVTKQLFELDPYLSIIPFSNGVRAENIDVFLGGENPARLVFEVIDDLRLKILLRHQAQRQKVPVVMLTSIGDTLLVDIERYDTDPSTAPFNGLVNPDDIQAILSGGISKSNENHYVMKIVGEENVPPEVRESVRKIGATLVGRPQLMSTIMVEAGVAAYLARRIALGDDIPSGRSQISFDNFIDAK